MVKRWLVLACLFCVELLAYSATEPTTTINGTLTNPFGNTSGSGSVSCALSESGTWDNDGTPNSVTTPVSGTISVDGTVSLVLTPNDAITPSGTYWICDWIETGVTRWRDQPVVPSDPDPIAVSGVPIIELPPPNATLVYGSFINRQEYYPYQILFDADGDTLWDVSIDSDENENSGIVLRHGFPFIQFGLGAKLTIKACTSIIEFFYDQYGDGSYDAATDFCWGVSGYDYNCDCIADGFTAGSSGDVIVNGGGVLQGDPGLKWDGSHDVLSVGVIGFGGIDLSGDATIDLDYNGSAVQISGKGGSSKLLWDGLLGDCDGDSSALGYDLSTGTLVCGDDDTGSGSGDMTKAVYDVDADSTVDKAEAISTINTKAAQLVDSNGDGTLDLDITAGMVASTSGDGTNKQRFAIFPGGYSSDPFDYTSGFVAENDPTSGVGAFYPIVSDPNYATLGANPIADLGTTTYKWRSGYFNSLYVSTATFNNLGYSNSAEGVPSLFWNSYNGQRWAVDYDSDNTAHQTFEWGYGTVPTILMRLDHDSTPEWWIDLDADGTPDIRFDGTDEPAHAEQLTWDGTAKAARWSSKADSIALGTDTTGGYAASVSEAGPATTATALAADPSDCSSGAYATAIAASGNLTCTTPVYTLTFTGATAVCNADPALFKAPAAMTITAVHCAVWAATSIPLSVEECGSAIDSCAGVDGATTITCDVDGAADDGSLSNPSIDSGDWIKLNFGSATGTITGATVTIYYTTP